MEQFLLPILLLIHVGGAIIGIGPSFAFAILGPMGPNVGPQGGLALLEGMEAVERKLVLPVALVTQPLSGVALIFVAGYATNFFGHPWPWIAILIYVAVLYTALFVQNPSIARMIQLAKAGPPTPEFGALAARTARSGPLLTVLVIVIVVLMVTKPGG